MDYNEELRKIQGNQSAILDTQQLLIETISFVLDSSEGIKSQLESIENEIKDIKNDLQQNQAMYATALLEQTNFFRQLIAGLQNDNQKSMEQISEIEKQNFSSLSEKLKSDYESLKKQIDNIMGNNDGIHKYLASLEELMRLIAANQLIKEVEKQITNDVKITSKEVATVAAAISHVNSEYDIGLNYYEVGRYKDAFSHFKIAADNGNTDAMLYLGKLYSKGLGTNQNSKDADWWYKKAARAGNKKAEKIMRGY